MHVLQGEAWCAKLSEHDMSGGVCVYVFEGALEASLRVIEYSNDDPKKALVWIARRLVEGPTKVLRLAIRK